jgi:ABC-2 type transport system permease protein
MIKIEIKREVAKGRRRRLRALIRKEFYQVIRDPSSILITLLLPLILMFIYGYAISLDLDHLRIGLVLEDTSPDAQSFAQCMTSSRYFDVKIVRDRRSLERDIISGAVRGIVVIPSYFSAFRKMQDTIAPIQVIADGSETNTANFVQNYVAGVWQKWLLQEKLTNNLRGLPHINVQSRFWYNEELKSRNFLVPGSLAIIMTLIGTLLTALVIAREWERGTMEALMSTPVNNFELLLGKLVPYFFLGMMSMTMCFLMAVYMYEVPFRGTFPALLLASSTFLITALGVGLYISTIARNQFLASQLGLVSAFLPAFILSGFIFEINSMPTPIRLVTYLLPARYFVSSLQTLFLVGNVWSLLLYDLTCMTIAGIFLFLITIKNTRKRLD